MAEKNTLLVSEQELHEREQGLVEMEAQLFEQEHGVAQMERAFQKRNKTLLNLASFVGDQEQNLMRRAEAIGPKAKSLVDEMLAKAGKKGAGSDDLGIGLVKERNDLLERRRELAATRAAIVEERQELYASRYEAIERAEGAISELEDRLNQRERVISQAFRELITASGLMGDDDEDDDDDEEDVAPKRARAAPAPEKKDEPAKPAATSHQAVRDGSSIGGEPIKITSGAVSTPSDDAAEHVGANSRAEDKVTRKRRKARARARTNQFRITLEAQLNSDEPHEFFHYRDDAASALPGLFIATPNLLKVGREVRVRVGLGKAQLEATGVVSWRRQRGEAGGPPGMGIDLLEVTDADRSIVEDWVTNNPPGTV